MLTDPRYTGGMKPTLAQRFALTITRGIGSPTSIAIHTLLFAAAFASAFFTVIKWSDMLLILTTIVSLEAIYLSIFIQMTINYQSQSIAEVEKDVDEIQKDVDEIQEDIGEMQEDVEEIQEDVDEIQEDVEDISEDVEEMSEEEQLEEARKQDQKKTLVDIQADLRKLLDDIDHLKDVQR